MSVWLPTPSYLLLTHAQLAHVPRVDDGGANELFIPRQLRVGLTAEADDPSQDAVPNCRPCLGEVPMRSKVTGVRLILEHGMWIFAKATAE